jgi:hypothetical protein
VTRSALLASLAFAGLVAVASAQSPQTATVSTPAASAVLFEDRFASPDANTPGPRWREYTLRRNTVRAEESPWRINNNSLSFEALGTGEYIEDLVETVDTFPMDNVRVEFEFRGEAGTGRGYVGPTVWWSADARNLSGAGNVSTGPPLIGVQATYRWENRGTRGVTINVGGVMKDHPDAIFAGLNEPRFARHVLTIANGRVTYESAGFPAVTYPLASPPRPGERRHLAFGARVYDAGDVQVLQFRNLKITAPGNGVLTTGGTQGGTVPPSPGAGGVRTGPAVQVLSANVPPAGGTLSVQRPGDPLDRFTIEVPLNSYPAARRFAVSYEPIVSHTLGRSVTPISPLITVDNGGALADAMMRVTIPVKVPEGYFAMGFFVDPRSGKLEGMPLLAISREAITVATRHFSSFLVSMIPLAELDQSILSGMIDTGFRPGLDDWEFPNLGSYIEPDGHCAGQSLTALWYFVNRPDGPGVHLWNRYDRNGARPATPDLWYDDSRAYRLASTVHNDINWGTWENKLMFQLAGASDHLTLRAFAYAMIATGEPQEVGIFSSTGGGHDMVAYLIKDSTLYIADPNYPGDNNRRIVFDHATGKFKPYNSGLNAAAIAAGHGQAFETIQYAAKSATVDWGVIGRRWGEMQAGSIGTSLFPGYQLYWVNEQGQPTPLTEGAVIEQTYVKFAFKVTGAAESAALIYLNGAPAEKSVNGMYELRPGRNEVGVALVGKRTAAQSDYAYIDFKYVNVNSAATPVDDPKPDNDDNLCASVLESASAAGMSPTAYYRAEAAKNPPDPSGQPSAAPMEVVVCGCPVNVSDSVLLACLEGRDPKQQ